MSASYQETKEPNFRFVNEDHENYRNKPSKKSREYKGIRILKQRGFNF